MDVLVRPLRFRRPVERLALVKWPSSLTGGPSLKVRKGSGRRETGGAVAAHHGLFCPRVGRVGAHGAQGRLAQCAQVREAARRRVRRLLACSYALSAAPRATHGKPCGKEPGDELRAGNLECEWRSWRTRRRTKHACSSLSANAHSCPHQSTGSLALRREALLVWRRTAENRGFEDKASGLSLPQHTASAIGPQPVSVDPPKLPWQCSISIESPRSPRHGSKDPFPPRWGER